MAGEIAIPISIYAAAEAGRARDAAERAEMQAFVNGYDHATATPQERQRYVESVRVLYPQAPRDHSRDAMAGRITGGFIVAAFLFAVIGAIYGHFAWGDPGEGAQAGGAAFLVLLLGLGICAVIVIGFALLFGFLP